MLPFLVVILFQFTNVNLMLLTLIYKVHKFPIVEANAWFVANIVQLL
jgi:hypothetical protein